MPTIALEGTGASILFATSSFNSDLLSLTLPEKTRAEIETTHLGTTGAKTFKPAVLKEVGTIECEFDHQPQAIDLTGTVAESITISYPLISGQITPTKLQFSGFCTKQGGEEFKVDDRMSTKVSIRVNGDFTVIPST